MMKRIGPGLHFSRGPRAVIAGLATLATMQAIAAEAPLRIVSIDVEGGAATLYITPQGHTVLIDAGWPEDRGRGRAVPGAAPRPPTPSSAQRIVNAAKAAGVAKIDYLIVTHYHVDHVGGVKDLVALMPIGTFVDHGVNRETPMPNATPGELAIATEKTYPIYTAAIAGKKHRVLSTGQTLQVDDLKLFAVSSDGMPVPKPMAGGGAAGVDCAASIATIQDDDGGEENPRSVGLVANWGKTRILALGDMTWAAENSLVCPLNRIGKIDLMFIDNHGSGVSNSPALLKSVRPTAVLFNNGATKGGDGEVLDRVNAITGPQGFWQLHFATKVPTKNAPADQIANPAGEDGIASITVTVERNGTFTLTNDRNGFKRSYGQAR